MPAKIVMISGACGTGKSSVSRILSESSTCSLTVHMHTDDFYQYIRKGYTAPWLDESGDQNETVIEAAASSAAKFLEGGYEVYVDGVIGPWFLAPWTELARAGADIRYIVLRPDEQTTVSRAMTRPQRECFPLEIDTIKHMWHFFDGLGVYESNTVDTTGQTPAESAALIRRLLDEGAFRLL